jgi:hypothetical protein
MFNLKRPPANRDGREALYGTFAAGCVPSKKNPCPGFGLVTILTNKLN